MCVVVCALELSLRRIGMSLGPHVSLGRLCVGMFGFVGCCLGVNTRLGEFGFIRGS